MPCTYRSNFDDIFPFTAMNGSLVKMNTCVTPVSLERPDEEASFGEDSVYFTPEVSFMNTTVLVHTRTPNATEIVSPNSRDLLTNPEWTPFRSSVIQSDDNEQRFKPANDKENTGHSTLVSEFVNVPLRCHASTPLNCITNSATPVSAARDVRLSAKSIAGRNTVVDNSKSNSHNAGIRVRRSILQKLGIHRKSTGKWKVVEESMVPDVSLDADDETIVIRIPRRNYGAVGHTQSIAAENTETVNDAASAWTEPPVDESDADSSFSLPDKSRTTIVNPTKRWFRRLYPRRSAFSRIRLSPVKRLFTRAAARVYLFHEKYVKKLFEKEYEPLEETDPYLPKVIETDDRDIEYVTINKDVIKQLSLKLDCVVNVEQLMCQMVLKLDSLQAEVKVLKRMLDDMRTRRSTGGIPPPPPPPPPAFPTFLGSATTKRKSDLTTPENDQIVKRPSRIVEQRAQFSITVEDLKNVKLRKTGNTRVSGSATVEKQSIRDLSFHSATISKRGRRSRLSNKKDLSEIAAQLLSSPRKQKADRVTSSMVSSSSSMADIVRSPVNVVYDQTPVRAQRKSSTIRSVKRKDWSGESPVRKRLNSGCSSPAYYDSHSDTAE